MKDASTGDRPDVIGGGARKVLHTLATVRRMGLGRTTRALIGHNACKACGYGMGGQLGGMTNELGEFPSVCNKSIQAQSSDVQAAIPLEVFSHPIVELAELDGREIEHLGRLDTPLYRAPGASHFQPVSWEQAIERAGRGLAAADAQRRFFYASGRSSNEAGFVFQLLARLSGCNHVNNCSYYCHQATTEGLSATIGTGTATVELADLNSADLIFVIGANPASNHPRFIHMLKACRDRGGRVVVINPAREPGLVRFAIPKSPGSLLRGGDEIASDWLQPHIGGDIAVLLGLCRAVLDASAVASDFVSEHTVGYDAFAAALRGLAWADVETAAGIPRQDLEAVAAHYARASNAVFAWGMGVTHHLHGVANVEAIANLALLRGMVGRPGAGLLPLRGHSNVQGIGTIGVKPVLAEEVLAHIEADLGVELPRSEGLDTMACMEATAQGRMDAALVMGGNLLEATPDTAWASSALARLRCRVHLTTTLNRGHVHGIGDGEVIILPVTARDEEWQATTQESMFNYVRMSDGGIRRLDGVRPESQVLCDLAAHLVPADRFDFEPFRGHRRVREAIAASVPGMEQLADIDVARKEFHVARRILHAPVFDMPQGRARFREIELPEVASDGCDLTLASVRSEGQFNTIVYEDEDSYRYDAPRRALLLCPEDMARWGLDAGARIDVCSNQGRMRDAIVTPFDVQPGNALAYFPEANVLVGREVDARSRTPAFKSVRAWLEWPGGGRLARGDGPAGPGR